MWSLFKKGKQWSESGVFRNGEDFHSHILFGVDDGAKTLEDSLSMLAEYEKLGLKHLWLTPHIMEDLPNTTEKLQRIFHDLQQEYSGEITLHLSAEYMLDNLFNERLNENDLLPLGEKGNHLLVEMSYFNPSMDYLKTLQRIQERGYYPVLAHPERYIYMGKSEYEVLKGMGILFQLNFFSLLGGYGKGVQEKAKHLLKNGMYDVMGADLHHISMFELLHKKVEEKILSLLPSRNKI